MRRTLILVLPLALVLSHARAPAQPKAPEKKKEPPKLVLASPMGVIPGKPTKLTLFGLRIDNATVVRLEDPRARGADVKVLAKKKVPVNQKQDANRIGDSHVEIELTLPADTLTSTVALVVETPEGISNGARVMIDREGAITPEKEPNNGFTQAQPVKHGQVIAGAISQGQDVDVYRIEGQEGQRYVFDVLAARYGSALEPTLTLHDAEGRIVATGEEVGDRSDARLDIKLPRAGVYYLSIIDAHDQGGPAYPYRLLVGDSD